MQPRLMSAEADARRSVHQTTSKWICSKKMPDHDTGAGDGKDMI